MAILAPAASAADNIGAAETLRYNSPLATNVSSFTTEAGEANTDLAVASAAGCAHMARTNWLVIEGTGTSITVTTAGSTLTGGVFGPNDTVLAVHDNTLTQVACKDDDNGPTVRTSTVTFSSVAGQAYFIQAGAFCNSAASCITSAPTGTIVVRATNAGAPSNDLRANAESLPLNSPTHRSNSAATVEPGETLVCPNQGPNNTRTFGTTLWFRFSLPGRGSVRIRTGGQGADSVIAVYPAASATSIACNDDAGSGDLQSFLALDLDGGDYLLQLGGFNNAGREGFGTYSDYAISVDFTPNFDLDGDGVLSPAGGGGDCDDTNAAIHPGVPDPPSDGIDQNCDGRDPQDADHDGVLAPPDGPDCGDHNAAIHPGAPDPPSDGIDQNCDGRDPKDADHDGALAPPDGTDCNDANAAIRPGAPEIPGNGIDDNCDGVSVSGTQLSSTIQFAFDRVGCHGSSCAGVRLTRYTVFAIPAGATVTLRCSGKGCPFATKKSVVKSAKASLSRLALFKHRTLRRGVVVRLTVTAPQRTGIVKTQIVGKRSLSSPKSQCLPAGSTRPSACAA